MLGDYLCLECGPVSELTKHDKVRLRLLIAQAQATREGIRLNPRS